MTRYSTEPEAPRADPARSCKARGSQLRTHFKKMREVGAFIAGMELEKAIEYLEQVLEFKRAIPFKRFNGGCGRHAQAKIIKATGDQVGWPIKSCKYMLDLLQNLKANGESKGLDISSLVIRHCQVNNAIKMRRRTYRAHGRIGPYMCNPCHVELWACEKLEKVAREPTSEFVKTRPMMARERRFNKVAVGGGI